MIDIEKIINLIAFTLKCNFNKRQKTKGKRYSKMYDCKISKKKIFHMNIIKDMYLEYIKKSLTHIRKEERWQKDMRDIS